MTNRRLRHPLDTANRIRSFEGEFADKDHTADLGESLAFELDLLKGEVARLTKLVEGDEDLGSPSVRKQLKSLDKKLNLIVAIVSVTVVSLGVMAIFGGIWIATL